MNNYKVNGKSILFWVFLLVVLSLIAVLYGHSLSILVERWNAQEEYSYGYFIPLVVLFFIYQKRNKILKEEIQPSWSGVAVILVALLLMVIGELSAIYVFFHYSLILLLIGLVLGLTGSKILRHILVPLLMLLLMIPLPEFVDSVLSWRLQLISSQIGVMFIRLFDIPVFLEGNVIDLGSYKLQVVEACSGLNYLFPLMSLGVIAAYLFKSPVWQKLVIVVSTVPITILMNSFRIGVVGVLVNYWGIEMAEGFLHFFEGWIIFLLCLFLLVSEMWLLTKLRKNPVKLSDVFLVIDAQEAPKDSKLEIRMVPQFVVSMALLIVVSIGLGFVSARDEVYPERMSFSGMPMMLGGWKLDEKSITPSIVQSLKLDDYYIADIRKQDEIPVNFYVAYYKSQRKGASPHSPRVCIPGGGWTINEIEEKTIPLDDNTKLPINRIIIEKNDERQLVYYWFSQRGRTITNEYKMKWYLLYDSIFLNRTDGALIRLTTRLPTSIPEEEADQRLIELLKLIHPTLDGFIPG